jgi:hypothetical protein
MDSQQLKLSDLSLERHSAILADLRHRLRDVCEFMDDDEFEAFVERVAAHQHKSEAGGRHRQPPSEPIRKEERPHF